MGDARLEVINAGRQLRTQVAKLADQLRQLAGATRALESRTRHVTAVLTDLPTGLTEVPIIWSSLTDPGKPYPDTAYAVQPTLIAGPVAQAVLTVGLKPGSKTPGGCIVQVVNSGANVIASVGVDVITLRDVT